jgi:DNA-directed RNA polymerase subunit RPC12/RpoP
MDQINPTVNYKAIVDSPNIVCECGCKTFAPAAILKKVSRIVTMTGRDEIVDIPVYVCTKCGKIPQDYMDKANAARILGESTGDSSTETKTETKSSSLIL